MKYVPRPGAHLKKGEAVLVGQAMAAIRESGEAVSNESLIAYARPRESPIHRLFEWDRDKLAHEALIERARYLIRNVVLLEVKTGKMFKADYSVRIETRTTPDGERAWHQRSIAVSREDAMKQLEEDFAIRLKTVAREIRQTGMFVKVPRFRPVVRAIERAVR